MQGEGTPGPGGPPLTLSSAGDVYQPRSMAAGNVSPADTTVVDKLPKRSATACRSISETRAPIKHSAPPAA